MSTAPDSVSSEVISPRVSHSTEDPASKPNIRFRSPQDFSLAVEDALKTLQSKIEDMSSTLNGKLNDMETKMQLLEKAINEASPIIGFCFFKKFYLIFKINKLTENIITKLHNLANYSKIHDY